MPPASRETMPHLLRPLAPYPADRHGPPIPRRHGAGGTGVEADLGEKTPLNNSTAYEGRPQQNPSKRRPVRPEFGFSLASKIKGLERGVTNPGDLLDQLVSSLP